ncbi:hypothetical protein [Lichenifustis flavocetrariae]|uniref:Uncharacterized protein n=1 Tax=Lichenifustis flavocetrariae TaxID=2949735 RepID=A0AA41Z4F7_9HYPH|nr:hypothetical protein [Lichenifustis flavocetrariae]MCW6512615.1 hypothetical protein [Lichenifustis flavocetrariae]
MTDYQDEHPQADAPFFAAADLGDAPLTASAGALFRPIATAPAVSSAEEFARRASEVALSSDTAVIARAKRVARIARVEGRAFGRASSIEEKVDEMLPKRPPVDAAREAADAAYKAEIEAVGGIMA